MNEKVSASTTPTFVVAGSHELNVTTVHELRKMNYQFLTFWKHLCIDSTSQGILILFFRKETFVLFNENILSLNRETITFRKIWHSNFLRRKNTAVGLAAVPFMH